MGWANFQTIPHAVILPSGSLSRCDPTAGPVPLSLQAALCLHQMKTEATKSKAEYDFHVMLKTLRRTHTHKLENTRPHCTRTHTRAYTTSINKYESALGALRASMDDLYRELITPAGGWESVERVRRWWHTVGSELMNEYKCVGAYAVILYERSSFFLSVCVRSVARAFRKLVRVPCLWIIGFVGHPAVLEASTLKLTSLQSFLFTQLSESMATFREAAEISLLGRKDMHSFKLQSTECVQRECTFTTYTHTRTVQHSNSQPDHKHAKFHSGRVHLHRPTIRPCHSHRKALRSSCHSRVGHSNRRIVE